MNVKCKFFGNTVFTGSLSDCRAYVASNADTELSFLGLAAAVAFLFRAFSLFLALWVAASSVGIVAVPSVAATLIIGKILLAFVPAQVIVYTLNT